MARMIRCKDCSAVTPINEEIGSGRCSGCGKPLRLKQRPPATAEAAPPPKQTTSARSLPFDLTQRGPLMIGGGAVLGLCVLAAVVLRSWNGGGAGPGAGAGGGAGGGGPAVAGSELGEIEKTTFRLDKPVPMPARPPRPGPPPYEPRPDYLKNVPVASYFKQGVVPVARAAADPIDRTEAKVTRAVAPARWSVPPPGPPLVPSPVGISLPDAPIAVTAKQVSLLRVGDPRQQGSASDPAIQWLRFDRTTGGAVGEPVNLYTKVGILKDLVVAVRGDDRQIAVRDPLNLNRVDLWDDSGNRVAGYTPFGEETITALGFGADGLLLIVGLENLLAVNPATHKAAYEVEGGYMSSIQPEPGGRWAAIRTARGPVDLVDTASGAILGQVNAASGAIPALAPDGLRMVAVVGETRVDGSFVDRAQIVNMADGTIAAEIDGPSRACSQTGWIGTEVPVLSSTSTALLLNPSGKFNTARLNLNGITTDRAGGLWKANGGAVTRIDYPDPLAGAALGLVPGAPVRLEIDCSSVESSVAVAQALAIDLQARGYRIGPGGWLLRATHRFGDGSGTLGGPGGAEPVPIQQITVTYTLVAPDGTTAWSADSKKDFDPDKSSSVDRSATFKASRNQGPFGAGSGTVVNLGSNPIGRMRQEIGTKFRVAGLPPSFPAGVITTQGRPAALPVDLSL